MDILEKFIYRDFIERELKFSEFYRYLDRYKNTETEVFQSADIERNESIKLNLLFGSFGIRD